MTPEAKQTGPTYPYAVQSRTITQTHYEYDENGNAVFTQTVEVITTDFVPCTRERCGAWHAEDPRELPDGGYCTYGGNT